MKTRVFISIDLPESIKKEIKKIQNNLPEFNGKTTEIENLHLTLKFLGWIDDEKLNEIKQQLRTIKSKRFDTEINSLGVFDNRKSGSYTKQIIIWLHMTNVEPLQKKIDEKLEGLFEKEKRFMSHLTIARVKDVEDWKKFKDALSKIKVKEIKFNVTNFRLKKSTLRRAGPIYETIEEYALD